AAPTGRPSATAARGRSRPSPAVDVAGAVGPGVGVVGGGRGDLGRVDPGDAGEPPVDGRQAAGVLGGVEAEQLGPPVGDLQQPVDGGELGAVVGQADLAAVGGLDGDDPAVGDGDVRAFQDLPGDLLEPVEAGEFQGAELVDGDVQVAGVLLERPGDVVARLGFGLIAEPVGDLVP